MVVDSSSSIKWYVTKLGTLTRKYLQHNTILDERKLTYWKMKLKYKMEIIRKEKITRQHVKQCGPIIERCCNLTDHRGLPIIHI